MHTIRLNTFETNSSSTHCMSLLNDEEMTKFKRNEFWIDSNTGETYTVEDLTNEYNEDYSSDNTLISTSDMLCAVQNKVKGTDDIEEVKALYNKFIGLKDFLSSNFNLCDEKRFIDYVEYSSISKTVKDVTITGYCWEVYDC